MNKDVIYIEPEDDITDILANVKAAKNKIIALVPPKKAGVLRSAVNFKLIAKTARVNNKTIVLISSDESLLKLASAVKMPVAKTLNSKPQLPTVSAKEYGDEPSDTIEAAKPAKKKIEPKAEPAEEAGEAIDAEVHPEFKTAKDAPKKEKEIETIELDEGDGSKEKKAVRGAKGVLPTKVPNILKYRKWIIIGGVAALALILFVIWGWVIAPAANIAIKIKTSAKNFAEEVSFVTEADKASVENGTFYIESKSIEKKTEAEFEATGELDKGQKATGTIQVTIKSGTSASCNDTKLGASINAGSIFIFGEVAYKVTSGASVSVDDLNVKQTTRGCELRSDATFGAVSVEAVENGDKYNIAATSTGWTLNSDAWYANNLSISSSEMTGGTSEIAKVVSKDDIEKVKNNLTLPSEKEMIAELTEQFGGDYIIIQSSMDMGEVKYTPTPDVEGEIKDGQKAKLTAERKYTVYAVKRQDVNDYIMKKAHDDLGDNTQTIYSSGVSGFEKKLTESSDTSANAEKDSVFFESFKKGDASITAKLKSTVLVAPEVNEDMVREKSLGNKAGEVRTALKSINGVQDVTVKTFPSFNHKIPKEAEKVKITIELAQ